MAVILSRYDVKSEDFHHFGGGICNMTANLCGFVSIPSGIIVEEESAQ
jgi:hypothetical protein